VNPIRQVRPSIWAAVVYLGLGFLWISFSDDAVREMTTDPESMTFLQNVKGWAFVIASSVMVFLLAEAVSWRSRRLRSREPIDFGASNAGRTS